MLYVLINISISWKRTNPIENPNIEVKMNGRSACKQCIKSQHNKLDSNEQESESAAISCDIEWNQNTHTSAIFGLPSCNINETKNNVEYSLHSTVCWVTLLRSVNFKNYNKWLFLPSWKSCIVKFKENKKKNKNESWFSYP